MVFQKTMFYIIYTVYIHNSDVTTKPPEIMEYSYDPPNLGRAFYFERRMMHECNVCIFYIDNANKKKKENHLDEKPYNFCTNVFLQFI